MERTHPPPVNVFDFELDFGRRWLDFYVSYYVYFPCRE